MSGALRFAKICDPSFSRNALAIVTFLAGPVGAQELEGLTWSEQKCVLYDHAVESALGFQGLDGLREEFLSENRSFIDGGCQPTDHVCPITDAEIELANLLTIMTMNEGMASTFVPFSCR
ncbi:hypothetical protein [Roseovarius sp. MMSF_3281]|uniref:hypothetical protein n=1 Tax=Roseovarius sp. MMSF_3281 TaxID=3046694 RepID=UPI00273F44FD|nr:hypothetical protein [Roseovarius sp. MMSF_3281]